jgi:hypothetical protein
MRLCRSSQRLSLINATIGRLVARNVTHTSDSSAVLFGVLATERCDALSGP